MKLIFLFFSVVTLVSCSHIETASKHNSTEKEIYKNWVLSRCLSYAFPNEPIKQDALNSASSYLEQSKLPVEAFTAADPLIKSVLLNSNQGSIPGGFKVQSCVELYHSAELEKLFLEEKGKQ